MCLFANVHIADVECNKTNEKYKMMKFDVIEKYVDHNYIKVQINVCYSIKVMHYNIKLFELSQPVSLDTHSISLLFHKQIHQFYQFIQCKFNL